jgi:hypothetical protein
MRKAGLLIIMFITIINFAEAQKIGNVWYFGKYCGITFDTPDGKPKPLTNSRLEIWEGCATISNSMGQIDLYTDGINVINKEHNFMAIGGNNRSQQLIGGSSSTQTAIVVPKPGDSLLYYIFTTDAFENQQVNRSTGLNYSIVDMRQDGGRGNIFVSNINILQTSLEKVTISRHANDKEYWIIAHTYSTNEFYAFHLSSNGLQPPVISRVQPVVGDNGQNGDQGYMKVNRSGTKLAAAYTQYTNVYLYDFDNQTGIVTNGQMLFPANSDLNFYGLEFSPDGTKLYASFFGIQRGIIQLDISSNDLTTIRNSAARILDEGGFPPGALQLGPDGKIYAAKDVTPYLHVINDPDKKSPDCNLKVDAVYLDVDNTGRKCHLGLPNTLNSVYYARIKGFASNPACEGDTVFLWSQVDASTYGYQVTWDGPNGFHSDSQDTMIVNAMKNATGWYYVTVNLNGLISVDSIYVLIADSPFTNIKTSGNTRFCFGDSVLLSADPFNPSLFYKWSTGDNTKDVVINKSGRYYLNIKNAGNCEYNDSIDITVVPLPIVSIKPRSSIVFCDGDSVVLEAVPYEPNVNYYWSTGEKTRYITVKTSGTIKLIAINEDQCKDSTEINIRVNNRPNAAITQGTALYICKGTSALLSAEPDGMNYLWSDGRTTKSIVVSKPGLYYCIVENSSECTDTAYIRLEHYPDNPLEIRGNTSFCMGDSTILYGYGNFKSYEWSNGDSNQIITIKNKGRLTLKAIDYNGCYSYDTVDIDVFELKIDYDGLKNISFGSLLIDVDSTITVSVTNNDVTACKIKSIEFGSSGVFSDMSLLPVTLIPGQTHNFKLQFSPQNIIDYSEPIKLSISEPCNITLWGNIRGTGIVELLISLPDTNGSIGDVDFCLPVRSKLLTQKQVMVDANYKISLFHNLDAFAPNPNIATAVSSEQRIATYTNKVFFSKEEIITENYCGTILLGQFNPFPVSFISVLIDNPNVIVKEINGSVKTNSICVKNLSGIISLSIPELKLVQNPIDDIIPLDINIPCNSDITIKLYNLSTSSQTILLQNRRLTEGNHNLKLEASYLPDGFYVLTAIINEQTHTLRFIKVSR